MVELRDDEINRSFNALVVYHLLECSFVVLHDFCGIDADSIDIDFLYIVRRIIGCDRDVNFFSLNHHLRTFLRVDIDLVAIRVEVVLDY